MDNFFGIFYLLFLFGCLISSIFIIYHITHYSINKKSSTIMFILFIFVLAVLLLFNIYAFSIIDFDSLNNINSSFNLNINNQSF